MKPLLFTAATEADVEEAFQWYEAQRPGLGAAFRHAIDVAVSLPGQAWGCGHLGPSTTMTTGSGNSRRLSNGPEAPSTCSRYSAQWRATPEGRLWKPSWAGSSGDSGVGPRRPRQRRRPAHLSAGTLLQDGARTGSHAEGAIATYVPRASTPLLDTLGRGVNDLAGKIAGLPENERPEHTVFVILTDGRENSSREFNKAQVVELVRHCQEDRGWHFTFLSAGLDAINDAAAWGIPPVAMLRFDMSARGIQSAYRATSSRVSDLRSGKATGLRYTDDDRKAQEKLRRKRSNVN